MARTSDVIVSSYGSYMRAAEINVSGQCVRAAQQKSPRGETMDAPCLRSLLLSVLAVALLCPSCSCAFYRGRGGSSLALAKRLEGDLSEDDEYALPGQSLAPRTPLFWTISVEFAILTSQVKVYMSRCS